MKNSPHILVLLIAAASYAAAVDVDSLPLNQQRSYSFKVDQLLKRVADGMANEGDMLELGRRNDPRITPVLEAAAVGGYTCHGRRWMQKRDRRLGIHSEKIPVNDFGYHQQEDPVIYAAKKAAARLGDQRYFDEFVVGLSSSNGRYRLDCINTLGYIGDRAALKYIVPIIDDCGYAYGGPQTRGPGFCTDALRALHTLIPMDDTFERAYPSVRVGRGKTEVDMWRPAIKQWWAQNKGKYATMPYGQEKSFDYVVNQ